MHTKIQAIFSFFNSFSEFELVLSISKQIRFVKGAKACQISFIGSTLARFLAF